MRSRNFGRHGDIKPENILNFAKPNEQSGHGTLKITDFGLTRFHTKNTKTYFIKSHKILVTPTYRPPECDMVGATISTSFDIWSFGCVILEFVTWYLGGYSYLLEFVRHRQAPNALMYGWNTDQFFELVTSTHESHYGAVFARVKLEVHEVRSAMAKKLICRPNKES